MYHISIDQSKNELEQAQNTVIRMEMAKLTAPSNDGLDSSQEDWDYTRES